MIGGWWFLVEYVGVVIVDLVGLKCSYYVCGVNDFVVCVVKDDYVFFYCSDVFGVDYVVCFGCEICVE